MRQDRERWWEGKGVGKVRRGGKEMRRSWGKLTMMMTRGGEEVGG